MNKPPALNALFASSSDQREFGSVETSENVLNGIAVDESSGHLFITGKRWPALFEIKLDARRP